MALARASPAVSRLPSLACRQHRPFWFGATSPEPEPENIFLRILRGEAPAEVIQDGDELFTFHDHNPASTTHLLVIPKRFIRDASLLTPGDAPLVRRMQSKAVELVQAYAPDFVESELAMGFHWPPAYSVPWLHLHAIYPIARMRRRWKYTPLSFKSPEWVLDRLQRQGLVFRPPGHR